MGFQIKEGASISGLNPAMRKALIVANRIMYRHGVDCVVTSGLDGLHSSGSLHYYGFAVDVRTRDLPVGSREEVAEQLKAELAGFDVVLESTHIHIENEIAFNRYLAMLGQ